MISQNSYSIQNIVIYSDTSTIFYNVSADNLILLNIYESLDKYGATAELTFLDYDYICQTLPIIGGERVKVILNDSFKDTLDLEFIVSEKQEMERVDKQGRYKVTLFLIEEHYFDMLTKSPSGRSYKDPFTISSTIYDIIETSVDIKDLTLDKTKETNEMIPNLYFPSTWTIYESIQYLLQFYKNSDEVGFFLIKDREEGSLKIISISELMKKELNIEQDIFNVSNPQMFNYIRNLEVKSEGQFIQKINESYLNLNSYTINSGTKDMVVNNITNRKFLEFVGRENSPISIEMDTKSFNNSSYIYSPEFNTESDVIQNMNVRGNMFFTTFEMSLFVNGRFSNKVGKKISIDYKFPVDGVNNNMAGEFIIYNITHSFLPNSIYEQTLLVVRDFVNDNERSLNV